jgi:hypothetical protein
MIDGGAEGRGTAEGLLWRFAYLAAAPEVFSRYFGGWPDPSRFCKGAAEFNNYPHDISGELDGMGRGDGGL